MKKYIFICIQVVSFSLLSADSDPFEDLGDYPFPAEEYPFDKQAGYLRAYNVISWSQILDLKHLEIREGQIDGFLKVYSAKLKVGEDKGKIVYKVLLYKSREDMKYNRLGSAVILQDYVFSAMPNNLKQTDPVKLNGKYCIIAGVFRRTATTTAVIAEIVKLDMAHFK